MSLLDAIDLAGGLREEASTVEVSRRRTSQQFSDTTSQVFTIRLAQGPAGAAERALAEFKLQPDDRVFVRASPGYRSQRFVELRGQFSMPGSYAINEGVDRIADVLERAGGLLPAAQPEGFRFLREGRTVAVDLRRAQRREPADNMLLQNGDQLSIDVSPTTVLVTGEVQRSLLVVFDRKLTVSDYIERAGGTRINADMSRVTVEYPSGVVRRAKSRFGKLRVDLALQPGAVITVPTKPDRPPRSFRDVLSTTLQLASAIASLALAYAAVTRD
jgi:protein involved in polysaccharide export with SLBB domain